MAGKIYGYVRVSTKEQNESRQLIAMNEFGITTDKIYIDKQSGKNFERPAYKNLLAILQPTDTLVVKSINYWASFGRGQTNYSNAYDVPNHGLELYKKGQFFGFNIAKHDIKLFHIEGLVGSFSSRMTGLCFYNNKFYVKMTPEGDGYKSGSTVTGYSIITPDEDLISNNWSGPFLQFMHCNEYGLLPYKKNVDATSNNYYCGRFFNDVTTASDYAWCAHNIAIRSFLNSIHLYTDAIDYAPQYGRAPSTILSYV